MSKETESNHVARWLKVFVSVCAFTCEQDTFTEIKRKPASENLSFYLSSHICSHPAVRMANYYFLLQLQKEKWKPLDLCQNQTRNQIEDKNWSAWTSSQRKQTQRFSLNYTIFLLFCLLPASAHPPPPPFSAENSLKYLALSHAVWNTWFDRDTFSVTPLPLTNQLCKFENRLFVV